MTGALLIGLGLLADAAITAWVVRQVPHWLPVAASSAAPHVDGLFALETGIGTFLLVACVAVILYTVITRRAPKYDVVNGDPIEGNLKLEITWTVLPLVVVMLITWHTMGVNATLATLMGKQRVLNAEQALQMAAGGPVQVIARQWSWEFVYPNGVRSAELHLPVDQPAELELISMDVLHGLYIPAFRLKQDLIPGSVIGYRLTPTREGRYRLRDSMFSGAYFASNQTDVVVHSPEGFEAWLAAAARQPLQPSWNPAQELWERRRQRGDQGWATVPPAPPPLVNVGLDPNAPHEG